MDLRQLALEGATSKIATVDASSEFGVDVALSGGGMLSALGSDVRGELAPGTAVVIERVGDSWRIAGLAPNRVSDPA